MIFLKISNDLKSIKLINLHSKIFFKLKKSQNKVDNIKKFLWFSFHFGKILLDFLAALGINSGFNHQMTFFKMKLWNDWLASNNA